MNKFMSRLCVSTALTAMAFAVSVPTAYAQDNEQAEDEIVVIGSYIRRASQADQASPTTSLGAEDIDVTGAKNIADITQTLTINTGAENNPDAFTQNSTTGTSSINLRGLGLSSTLVLLNGKRQVLTATTNNTGVQFVDTSSLVPLIAVDRLDILKDGASALYGSDAVAGVANFVTYDDFSGLRLNGSYQSVTGTGDANEYLIQGMGGLNFGSDDQHNVMLAVSYLDREELSTAEKRLSRAQDDTSALGNPGSYFGVAGFPAGAPVIDPTGCASVGGIPQVIQATPAGIPDVGLCGFDFGDYYSLIPQEERLTVYGQSTIDFGNNLEWRTELSYADNEAIRGNSPTFPFLQQAIVPSFNPNNIFGQDVVFFGRAIGNGGEGAPNLITSETMRLSTSLNGEFGDAGTFMFSFTHGTNETAVITEDVVTDRFQCSFFGFNSAAAADYGITDVNPATGEREPGCDNVIDAGATVGDFFNSFATSYGPSPNSDQLLDFIIEEQTRDLKSDLNVVEIVVTNELGWFEAPAGPIGYALGFQHRSQGLEANFDQISLNDNFGFLIGEQPYDGSQDVSAFFTELAIPVSDIIDVQAALRYEDYGGTIGSTVDPKLAVLIRPMDGLSLRGSYSTSFRAPSVFQQEGQATSLNQVVDPVLGGTAFAAVRGSGNPNLNPEESEAFNIGATWEPVNDLNLNVDFWSFEFTDVITPQNFQAVINADPNGPAVIRSPAGTIVQVNVEYVNANSVETSGIDFKADYTFDTGFGTFIPFVEGTYITKYDLEDPQAGSVDGAGNRNFTNFGTSTPELRYNAGVAWAYGAHRLDLFARHIDSYTDDQNPGRSVDSHTTFDWRYTLSLDELLGTEQGVGVSVGMINATDEDPPQVFTNGGFDSKVHDPRGQLTYISLDFEL